MNELPNEILCKVFTQLSLGQRLECTLVCHKWWSVLDERCLLFDVEIHGSTDCFNAFIDMINLSPHRAGQVKELRLSDCVDSGFNKRTLCNLFYNAHLIQVTYDDPCLADFHPFAGSLKMVHSRPRLESLTDSIYCELASQILTANLGSHLRTLELYFYSLDEFDTKYAFPKIQNLPVLKSLTLAILNFGINELENIHLNVPSIQELKLQDIEVLDSHLPPHITPALVTSLDISVLKVDNIETHVRCNAIHLTNIPRNVNIFRELDGVGARINEFDLFKSDNPTLLYDLSCSNQSKYTGTLRFIDMRINSVHLLQNMPKLTVVELCCADEINLTEYLNAFPETVIEFSVECDRVLVDPIYTRKTSIEMLIIDCHKLNQKLGLLISECFPNLVTLKLNCPIQNVVHIISHQDQPLRKATFGIYDSGISGFIFNDTGETAYYLYDGNTTCVERAVLEGLPCLTFRTYRSFELDVDGDTIIASRADEGV